MATIGGASSRRPSPGASSSRLMKWLLEKHAIVIAAGGGGIDRLRPERRAQAGRRSNVDRQGFATELLARWRRPYVMLTDADAVYEGWARQRSARSGARRPTPCARDELRCRFDGTEGRGRVPPSRAPPAGARRSASCHATAEDPRWRGRHDDRHVRDRDRLRALNWSPSGG